jgi:hypothetical protein
MEHQLSFQTRKICGGACARAYALTGNLMAEEPCCVYLPKNVAASAVDESDKNPPLPIRGCVQSSQAQI